MESPSYYLGEICQAVEEVTRVQVSEPTICRILRKNWTHKKEDSSGCSTEKHGIWSNVRIWQLFFLFLEKCLYL